LTRTVRVGWGAALCTLAAAIGASPPAWAESSAADELVRQARAHEATHEDDLAARRYTEALALDAHNSAAWMGLGDLRMRTRELSEAERVYTAALERLPSLLPALEGRARARWALGRHSEAELDLEAYAESTSAESAYRQLAQWFANDGRAPAELAVWRRLLAMAVEADDSPSGEESGPVAGVPEAKRAEARRMVRALSILVDGADPACSPIDPDSTRLALARIARSSR
jgi:tetratricopeptide (TPR) repeat protein